ncbi:hypothetical protein WME99_06225 [Sorangium sp. So ce136]|uniref:hypothetical protein n=1 Tax=Sorangium sp. So ce136 TaxID=3133284 RepID=UPI003F07CF32
MKRSVFGLGMVMAVGLLPAACGPESQLDGELAGPGLNAMVGKPGSEDTNGTPKRAWDTWKEPVARALQFPLLNSDGTINQMTLGTSILADPMGDGAGGDGAGGEDAADEWVSGHEVFDHTVRCALASGTAVTHNGKSYVGRGMVGGASVWPKEGLPEHVINNVLECVIAFVNDKTDGVNVLLTGPNVNDDKGEHTEFMFGEAVWCAHATGVAVSVYATRSFVGSCGMNAKAALEQRYCYEPEACNLDYKGILELNDECVRVGAPGSGQYKCNGNACTMTWLKDPDPEWCVPPATTPTTPPTPPTPLPQ